MFEATLADIDPLVCAAGAAVAVAVVEPPREEEEPEDDDDFTPPPPPEQFTDGEPHSDTITPPSEFREVTSSTDDAVHPSDDVAEDADADETRKKEELQAALIDELKQGRVSLKHNPAFNQSNSTTFNAVEMIY